MTVPMFAMLQGAAPSSGPGSSPLLLLWYVAGFGAIFYFLLFRPQQKQRKEHEALIQAVKKGDEIVTAGGIVGEIVHVKEHLVTVKSGESKLVVERDRIVKVTPRTPAAPAE